MNKRIKTHDDSAFSAGQLSKLTKNDWNHFTQFHPRVYNWLRPTEQYCKCCDEPVEDHWYYETEKSVFDGKMIIDLKCDRKILRTYYYRIRLDDDLNPYDVFLSSALMDVADAEHGRYTQ